MAGGSKKARVAKPLAMPTKKRSRLTFFGEAIGELRKARWPTREEALRLSTIVFVICVVVGAVLGMIDYGFTKLLGYLLVGG